MVISIIMVILGVIAMVQLPIGSAPAAGPGAAARQAPQQQTAAETRALAGRILAASVATGTMSNENKAYLVQLVSQQTGLPPQEVETRVNNAFTATREAIDKARRATLVTGLVTAVSLIVSFAAAWWSALKGGQHRDNAVPARFDFASRRVYGAKPMT